MLLLVIILVSAFSIRIARASTTIYIRADGSIDPSTSPIHKDGNVYTLTGDIISDADGIVIERSNIILNGAGYTLQGASTPSSNGIRISGKSNVTIKDMDIKAFESGILLDAYSNSSEISANRIEENDYGISCWGYSDGNSITGNNITANNLAGIWIVGSSNINVSENNIETNTQYGIILESSSNNFIYHNNFIDNTNQISIYDSTSVWDNGYPSGGNFWNDHTGTDDFSGPGQNQTGSDAIGDTPYICSESEQDGYPLMNPWTNVLIQNISPSKTVVSQGQTVQISVTIQNEGWSGHNTNVTVHVNATVLSTTLNVIISGRNESTLTFAWQTATYSKGTYTINAEADPVSGEPDNRDNALNFSSIIATISGDINGDRTVDIFDAIVLAASYGSMPTSSNWNANADINNDNTIDIFDAIILAANYGQTDT